MSNRKICIITGATGGIGGAIAKAMYKAGYVVIAQGRNQTKLSELESSLGPRCHIIAGDLNEKKARTQLIEKGFDIGQVDILINIAGLSSFGSFEQQADIESVMQTNLLTPMLLSQAFLIKTRQSETSADKAACIINVGSAFGYIGYPGFTSYCASKFGLRGFTQALSREYGNSAIRIAYFAPRATQTTINSDAVDEMNKALHTSVDSVEKVAAEFMSFLNSTKNEAVVGWPEKLFARINGAFPSIVHKALVAKLPIITKFMSRADS